MFHLIRRAVTSVGNTPLSEDELGCAQSILLPAEFSLWKQMQHRDQRHSLQVLHRFEDLRPGATRDERAAALLHDVGKVFSQLGWWGRIAATLVGSRTESFRTYINHEQIGLNALRGVSSDRTLEILGGDCNDAAAVALRQADNI